jgi:sugar diacid utilization regulator
LLTEPPAEVLADEWRILALFSNECHLTRPLQRRSFFRRLHHGLKAASGRLALGWSCVHTGASGWPRAFAEANQALSMVIQVLGPGQAASYAEVAVLSLVSGPRDPSHLQLLQEQFLDPLRLYDQEEHMDLTRTLEIYLESVCNASQTAELLRVHRNSVSNRLQRIKELCDVDLEDPDMRLLVQLILRWARSATSESHELEPGAKRPPGIWAPAGLTAKINGLLAGPSVPDVGLESGHFQVHLAETRA